MNDGQKPTIEQLQEEIQRIRNANIAFIKKVAKMRELQKEYFKTRDHATLAQSKALESQVDQYLKRCFDKMDMQDPEFCQKVGIIKDLFEAELCQTQR